MRWKHKDMQHRARAILQLLILIAGLIAIGCSQPESGSDGNNPPPSPSDECDSIPTVDSIATVIEDGARLDWSHSNNLIAFDRKDADGYFDVWIADPEGTDEYCLTCDIEALPSKHIGNPVWHPSGEWIVFQAEKEDHPGSSDLCEPGVGRNNDLWAMKIDGNEIRRLTNIQKGLSTLHPQFSHDGTRLVWGETESAMNDWVIKIADFDSDEG
ncbi:MAG TPA: hypothetical protein ENF73_05050, partial [Proteobacteria bacterium]|nr:hypothetical protein [Pseudomonadota bacterium]